MPIKDILVHVDDSAPARARFDWTLGFAEPFGARVSALYLLAEPFLRGVASHAPAEVVREHLAQAADEADEVLGAMAAEAARRGLRFRPLKHAGPLDRQPALLAYESRNSDLVIVSRPDPETGSSDDMALMEAAFMETGRPAIVLPAAGAAPAPFRRALVAWDASREASRAVHDALPILETTEEVVVLVVDPEELAASVGREPGPGVAAYLAERGVTARVKAVERQRRRTGEVLLAEVVEEGADLLVMGGYGRSRLREALFGGATRTLLAEAALPVLLSH